MCEDRAQASGTGPASLLTVAWEDGMDRGVLRVCRRYKWQGLGALPATLQRIKAEAFEEGGAAGVGRAGERREKSLGLLSQRFVQMFLQAPQGARVVTLEAAAETLLGARAPACA